MNKSTYLLTCCLFLLLSKSVIGCDTITVTMITHPSVNGPLDIEWDLEDEWTDQEIMDGNYIFSETDSIYVYTACLDSGCYRARARFDSDIEQGMFEIWVTLNGDTLETYEEIDYNDDDFKYYFSLNSFCQEDDEVGISEMYYSNSVFPNPADNHIILEHNYLSKGTHVSIRNSSGDLVYSGISENRFVYIDCSHWPNGNYVISLSGENYDSVVAMKSIISH
jgi:hypothetical protein